MPRSAVSNRQTLNLKQNFFRDSQDFSTASWTRENVAVTTESMIGPNGENINAGILTENSSSGNHAVYPTVGGLINMAQGLHWTVSAYLKAKERTYGSISIDMGSGNNITIINLSNGAITSSSDSVTSASVTRSVVAKQNGWYRIIMTMLQATNVNVLPRIGISPNGTSLIYAGNGSSGIYIWQPQFVRANWEGEETPTTASAITTPIRNKVSGRANVSGRIAIA